MIPISGLISLEDECTWPCKRSSIVKQEIRSIAVLPSGPTSVSKRTTSQTLTKAIFTAVGTTLLLQSREEIIRV